MDLKTHFAAGLTTAVLSGGVLFFAYGFGAGMLGVLIFCGMLLGMTALSNMGYIEQIDPKEQRR